MKLAVRYEVYCDKPQCEEFFFHTTGVLLDKGDLASLLNDVGWQVCHDAYSTNNVMTPFCPDCRKEMER